MPPKPLSASQRDGLESGREMVRCCVPNLVRFLLSVSLSPDSEAPLHTKVMAAKELLSLVPIPQAVPSFTMPPDTSDGGNGGNHAE